MGAVVGCVSRPTPDTENYSAPECGSATMKKGANKRAAGKGGIPSLLPTERARPALPEHERWPTLNTMRYSFAILLLITSCVRGSADEQAAVEQFKMRATVQDVTMLST